MTRRTTWILTLVAAALLAGTAHAQLAWTRASDSGPPGRLTSANGMAYDSDRGVVVLFGGGPGNSFGDTWEWNGARWKLRSRSGPSPRWGAVMAYDAVRRVTVLHGGCDCRESRDVYLDDTWEWDGKRWRQVAEGGPTAQYRYGVFDTRRGVLVLLVSSAGETWEWNGESWTLVTSEGPEFPRWNTSMAYDSRRGVTVLHGGVVQPAGTFADTWEWDGETWQRVSTEGPPVREAHALAYDSHRGRVVLMGGHSPDSTRNSLYDTWEWDGRRWRELMDSGAPARLTHTMVFDEARGRVLAFGGIRFDEPIETRGLKGDTWALESPIPASPSRRSTGPRHGDSSSTAARPGASASPVTCRCRPTTTATAAPTSRCGDRCRGSGRC